MGKRDVTIKDIAGAAGVSIATVSRYINQNGYVNDSTAQAIRDAIKETGYVPSFVARSLKTRRSHTFLLIVPDIENPFYSKIARRLQHLSQENGYGIMLSDSEGDTGKELEALKVARQISADGIFCATIDPKPGVIRMLSEAGTVVVGMNAFEDGMPFDTVVVHRRGGTNLAVKYLAELGHRDIVFAGGTPGTLIAQSRLNGYKYAMEKYGLPFRAQNKFEGNFTQSGGYDAGRQIAELRPLPTAVCCANDLIALGVIKALNEAGLRVPEDVSVTGMDDIPYAELSSPPLTTVENDGALFAESAFRRMLQRISGEGGEPVRLEIPNALRVRRSCRMRG